MALIVQKYGGTSVGDTDRIRNVAQRIIARRQAGDDVVVVVSAMGDATDDLIKLAYRVTECPSERELDVLLSTGEIVSRGVIVIAGILLYSLKNRWIVCCYYNACQDGR